MKLATLPLLLCVLMFLSVSEGVVFCPGGWALIGGRCFRYVPDALTWAEAEKNCLFNGANLASVHSPEEYRDILAVTHRSGRTWIGGSDSAQNQVWLWSDGKPMSYTNWCPHEPNNVHGNEHCLEMNHAGRKCWKGLNCLVRLPSVCVKKNLKIWMGIVKKEVEK
ncbi:ladderlectin [Austrofundulus limnaeus]|uniref:Ladderlectin n=1 Tax=Austrofundulus limnaeus TaxID=52670 RepID=A0A2I4AHZ7_AUSLI|nr:PREDICTED: ladderlectin-like [Austrofundulus limnaeus]